MVYLISKHNFLVNSLDFHCLILVGVLGLSIFNIFSSPLGFRPRSSAGFLTLGLMAFCYVTIIRERHRIIDYAKSTFGRPIDFFMMGYLVVNILSLIFTPSIDTLANLRFIGMAVTLYFFIQLSQITLNHKKIIIHALGGMTVFIAAISFLQMLFPDALNSIAFKYFGSSDTQTLIGDTNLGVSSSYNGLIADFRRGRLLHWGSLVLCFPAFYLSVAMLRNTKTFLNYVYISGGLALVTIAFISSNFRWTALCFIILTTLVLKGLYYFQVFSQKILIRLGVVFTVMSAIGLVFASLFLKYNIIERVLLTNPDRDVNETLGRFYLYDLAIGVMQSSPVLGVGSGNYFNYVDRHMIIRYFSVVDQYQVVLAPLAPHNDLLLILAESGLSGFMFFILIMYFSIKRIWLNTFDSSQLLEEKLFHLLGLAVILAFLLYSLFEDIAPHNYIFLFFFIGVAFTNFGQKKISPKRIRE